MKKALTPLLLLTLLAGLTVLPAAASALTPTRAERQVVSLINKERAKHGLAAVHFKASLTRAARCHSSEMANRHVLTHYSACGWTPAQRVRHYGYGVSGYRFWKVGEDLAAATAGTVYATPTVTVQRWMQSAAHRRIILTACFRDVGVGIAKGGGLRYFTLDLGRRY
jgi:uncharacterized protein YkwD